MSCFTTGGPGKEHGTNKSPPSGRVQERSKRNCTCLTTSQNHSHWHPSWMNKACTTKKDSESEWLAKDNPETNPITIKPETVSHMAEQFSWVPLPYCSPPRRPFPIKSLALSAHVSPRTIHFRVLDKSPVLGPGRGSPSCNKTTEACAHRTKFCGKISHCNEKPVHGNDSNPCTSQLEKAFAQQWRPSTVINKQNK